MFQQQEMIDMKRVSILGVPFIHTTMKDFIHLLQERIIQKEKTFIVTANPEIVMKANEDDNYMEIVQKANFVTADGIGVVKAAKLLNDPLPERVTGFDMMQELLKAADQHHHRVYLLGAEEAVLQGAMAKIAEEFPGVEIVGGHHGFFDWEQNEIASDIKRLEPDLVFVALGLPRQEQWIAQHFSLFDKGIFIGVGGCFDVLAGKVERAPEFWQKANLEWFYRLMKQPTRLKRMLVLPHFVLKVYGQKLKGKK